LLVDASVYCFPVGLELSPNFDFVESEVGFVALFDGFLCLVFDSFVVVQGCLPLRLILRECIEASVSFTNFVVCLGHLSLQCPWEKRSGARGGGRFLSVI